jgi:hypothetical protein
METLGICDIAVQIGTEKLYQKSGHSIFLPCQIQLAFIKSKIISNNLFGGLIPELSQMLKLEHIYIQHQTPFLKK